MEARGRATAEVARAMAERAMAEAATAEAATARVVAETAVGEAATSGSAAETEGGLVAPAPKGAGPRTYQRGSSHCLRTQRARPRAASGCKRGCLYATARNRP